MPNINENRDFISAVISSNLLDEAILYISSTMFPDEVFSVEQLEEWALEYGYRKDDSC